MALKPTIFKININLADLNNDVYDTLNLTVAQHPSETQERMVTRVLVYCLNVQEFLSFSKGLCVAEDPDILAKSLAGEYLLWIDVGEPAFERIKKACRQAQAVKVYSFNSKSDVWWQLSQKDFATLDVEVYQFQFSQIKALAGLLQRSMNLSLTLSGDSAYIAAELGECEITCRTLQAIEDL